MSTSSGPLVGYPGVLSREYVLSVVDEELRKQIFLWSELASAAKTQQSDGDRSKAGRSHSKSNSARRHRALKKDDDLSGLNDILETFDFDIPEQIIEQEILGATATFVISGQCGDISVDRIGLDYESKGEDLTYEIDLNDLDVKCSINVVFDFGVYDIEDDIVIDVKLGDNDFGIGVVLEGIPPKTSSFQGCSAEINIKDIKADGGFSANILNDLDDLVVDIVEQEVCSLLGNRRQLCHPSSLQSSAHPCCSSQF